MKNGFEIENTIYEDIDYLIICKICKKLINDPIQCESCSSFFCKFCLNQIKIENKKVCPVCNKNFKEKNIEDKILSNLKKIQIICKICKDIYVYNNASNHVCVINNKNHSDLVEKVMKIAIINEISLNFNFCKSVIKSYSITKEINFSLMSLIKQIYVRENQIINDENKKLKNDIIKAKRLQKILKKTIDENQINKKNLNEIQEMNIIINTNIEKLKNDNNNLKIDLEKSGLIHDENVITIKNQEEKIKIMKLDQELSEKKIEILTIENMHFKEYISLMKSIIICFNCNKFEKIEDILQNICKNCKQNHCKECIIKCEACNELYCEKHTYLCNICLNRKCKKEMLICMGCNKIQCKQCMSVLCRNCDWKFKDLPEETNYIEDNIHKCISNESASNKIYFGDKVFSNGFHKWEVKFKFPICEFIDFGLIRLETEKMTELNNHNNFEKISIKSLSYFTAHNYCNIPLILAIDLKKNIFSFQVGEFIVEKKIDGYYFLPYFQLCNNSISLKHYFIFNKI